MDGTPEPENPPYGAVDPDGDTAIPWAVVDSTGANIEKKIDTDTDTATFYAFLTLGGWGWGQVRRARGDGAGLRGLFCASVVGGRA